MPIHPEDYIHRIGRTGRAGREGFAAMLVTPKDIKALKAIEKMLKQEIPWIDGAPSQAEAHEGAEARPRTAMASIAAAIARNAASAPAPQDRRALSTVILRNMLSPFSPSRPSRSAAQSRRTAMAPNGGMSIVASAARAAQASSAATASRRAEKQPRGAWRSRRAPQANVAQAPRGKQQGMGDHVPAFMMRPVRVT